jgi:hypothetical protein
MRTSALVLASSLVALAPRLALADEPPAALPQQPSPALSAPSAPPPTTVIVVADPAPAPAYTPGYVAPMWYGAPPSDTIVMRRRNKGLMIGGLVMIPIGLAGLIGGIAMAASFQPEQANCKTTGDAFGDIAVASVCGISTGMTNSMGRTMSYMLAISGGMMTAAGTTMAIVGGQIVPRKQRALPRVGIGPASVDLTWTF